MKINSMSNINRIFAINMHARRKELKLSQEKLGELCNLHRTYIGGIEQFGRNPSLKSMGKIAEALEIDLWLLLLENYQELKENCAFVIKENNNYKFLDIDDKRISTEDKEQIKKFIEKI